MTHRISHHLGRGRAFSRKLSAYALGAAAVGAAEARAAIVYTDLGVSGVSVENGAFTLDLNHDGHEDFEFTHFFGITSDFLDTFGSVRLYGTSIIEMTAIRHYAARFERFDEIDPSRADVSQAFLNDIFDTSYSRGPFACDCAAALGARGFLGVAFAMNGRHAAWIDVYASARQGFTVYGFAYETEPDMPIVAGDTGNMTLPGDTNADGRVDLLDLNNVLNNFAERGTIVGDANADGRVDLKDLNLVQNNFGATSGARQVPEPPTLVLLAAGAAGLGALRRRRSKHDQS